MDDFNYLLGMTIDQGEVSLLERHSTVRVIRATSEDGQHYFGTCDYRLDRLNVGLTNGVISSTGGVG